MDVMQLRRSLLIQSSVRPPDGYKLIEYAMTVSKSGRVYLPFGFDKTDEIEMYAAIDNINAGDQFLLAPSVWNDNVNRFALVGGYSQKAFGFGYGNQNTGYTVFNPVYRDNLFHKWTYKGLLFGITDLGVSFSVNNLNFGGTTKPLICFFGYADNTSGKIAYFKQKKANGDRLYILPVQHKETGTVEMYDTVSKTIMQRMGTLYAPTI